MAISITRYVAITSGRGAGTTVAQRALILRMITQNAAVPPQTVVTFENLDDVAAYVGTNTDEYAVAAKYFGFVSKVVSTPQALSMIRWTPAATAPQLYGDTSYTLQLTALTSIIAGNLDLIVSGQLIHITGLDFQAASDFPAVATVVQTALQGNGNPQLATATVTYDGVARRFIITGSVPGTDTISATPAASSDVGSLLGLTQAGAISAAGSPAQSAVDAISQSAVNDDNFGSFAFVGAVVPTDEEMVQVSAWNHAQNNKFMFCCPVNSANAATQATAMSGNSGTALSLAYSADPADHAETVPAEILAATDYNRPGASANYMFQQLSNRTPTVTDNANANTYDAMRVNYMGQTQSAGQKISFYQRGFLQGDPTAALGMEVYAGEMWLKSAMTSTILSAFLNLNSIPANETGRITLLAVMQGVVDQGLVNNVIAPGKTLTPTQQAYITNVSGNTAAWRQVQDKGYWMDATIEAYSGPSGVTEYRAKYILIYGAADAIRKVEGSDILI